MCQNDNSQNPIDYVHKAHPQKGSVVRGAKTCGQVYFETQENLQSTPLHVLLVGERERERQREREIEIERERERERERKRERDPPPQPGKTPNPNDRGPPQGTRENLIAPPHPGSPEIRENAPDNQRVFVGGPFGDQAHETRV